MELLKAMQACKPGGYVARKAYPNRKYFKNEDLVFLEAVGIDHIDFIATDWEPHVSEHRDELDRSFP
jgi:hypothetical protein